MKLIANLNPSVRKQWPMKIAEKCKVVYDNGQEGKGTVSSGGPRCSVGRAQVFCFCVCLCKQLVMVQGGTA